MRAPTGPIQRVIIILYCAQPVSTQVNLADAQAGAWPAARCRGWSSADGRRSSGCHFTARARGDAGESAPLALLKLFAAAAAAAAMRSLLPAISPILRFVPLLDTSAHRILIMKSQQQQKRQHSHECVEATPRPQAPRWNQPLSRRNLGL